MTVENMKTGFVERIGGTIFVVNAMPAENAKHTQGVTEELKATDMMRWIGLMNNIRACADEIVLNDIVYS